MALTVDIADAVAAELAAGDFNPPAQPVRRVLPEFDLASLAELRVTVVPRGVETAAASRATTRRDVRIDIGVQKKLAGDPDAEVPALCDRVERIASYLQGRPLRTMPAVRWLRTANEPVYAPEHLAEHRVFTSVLTVTYRVLQ